MAGALGEAVVEILADIDHFDEDVRRRLAASADAAAEAVQRDMDRISRSAAEAGRNLADSLGDGARRAQSQIERMTRLANQANSAFEDLDADGLARVSAEAQRATRDFNELARAARAAEGQFQGMDPAELEGIARAAEAAARNVSDIGQQARNANAVLTQFRGADLERLAREAQEAADRLARLSRTPLRRIGGEAREAGRAIFLAFRSGADGAEDALRRIDNARFNAVVRRAVLASVAIRRAFDRARKDADFSGAAARIVGSLRTIVAAGAGLALLGIRFASLVSIVGAVGAALAPTAGILAGLPATIGLVAGAVATLKVGLSGVGDAFKAAASGDAAAFDEALKKLAPSARRVATEVKALKPALDGLRKSVQGALFKPLIGELTAVAKNLGGPLKAGMTATAAQFGRLGASVTAFGKSASAVELVRGLFSTLSSQIAGIKSGTVTGLLDAIARFTVQTLPGFGKASASIDGLIQRLTAFLNRATAGGKALAWLESGKAAFRQLGAIAGDVGSIIGTVFTSIQSASGGTLGQFKAITGQVRAFVDEAARTGQLTQIFQAINATAAAAAPALGALLRGLAAIAPIVQQLSVRLGPILTQAIAGLVPAIQGVLAGLIPVFDQLGVAINTLATGGGLTKFGQAVGEVLAALSPLLPAIASIINSGLNILAPALSALAPVVSLIARALAALADSPVGPYLGLLAAQFAVVFAITGKAGLAFRSLLPTLRLTGVVLRLAAQAVLFLGRALVTALIANPIVAAIAAIIAVLVLAYFKIKPFREAVDALGRILLAAGKAVINFGKSLVDAFKADGVSGVISKIGEALGNLGGIIGSALSGLAGKGVSALAGLGSALLSGLQSGFSAVVSFLAGLPGRVASALVTFGPVVLRAIASGLGTVLGKLVGFVAQVVAFFVTLPIRIGIALLQFGPTILRAIVTGLGAVLSFLANFVIQVLAFFITLPFRILGALLSLAIILRDPFIRGFQAAIAAVTAGITAIIGFVTALPGRIVAGLLALPGLLANAARTAWRLFNTASIAAGNAIISFARALPGRIVAGVRALVGLLRSLASSAWNGFKAASSAGISAAIAIIRGLPGKALAALRSFISSMRSLGADVMRGFIDGIRSLAGNLVSAVTGPIGDAIGKAKSLLKIGSPSKVFHAMGSDTLQGFINGSSEKAKKAAAVFRKMVGDIIDITGRGFVKGLTGNSAKITSTIERLVKAIQKAFKGKKTNLDDVLIKQLDATNKRLQALAKKRTSLADQVKKATEFANNVTESARQFGGITNVTADENGKLTGEDIDKQLKARLKSIERFQQNLNALAKRGLNKSTIEQIASQGVDQGGGLAAALAASQNTTINSINNTTKQINAAASNLGKSTADLLFDSGKNAGKGFLDGLKSQQAEIEKLMVTIAKSAANAIRKTLKIKSPSQVMESLGDFTIRGFLEGIEALAPEIGKALEGAVRIRNALARQLEANTTTGSVDAGTTSSAVKAPTAPSTTTDAVAALVAALDRLAARTGGTGVAGGTTVNAPITVNLPTADPDAVAQVIGRRVSSIANR